jgi:hypothetical protein
MCQCTNTKWSWLCADERIVERDRDAGSEMGTYPAIVESAWGAHLVGQIYKCVGAEQAQSIQIPCTVRGRILSALASKALDYLHRSNLVTSGLEWLTEKLPASGSQWKLIAALEYNWCAPWWFADISGLWFTAELTPALGYNKV